MSYAILLPSQNPEWADMDSTRAGIILEPAGFGADTIPDLTGLTAKDAVFMLEKAGIPVIIRGKGIVNGQSVPAGAPMSRDTEIVLTLGNIKEIEETVGDTE
jgi:cell division protein FtsI (penicillin-binding protein 3)